MVNSVWLNILFIFQLKKDQMHKMNLQMEANANNSNSPQMSFI
jgi:hypothetical protein